MKLEIKNGINKINIDGNIYGKVEFITELEQSSLDVKKINLIKNKFLKLINGKNQGKNKIFVQKAKNIKGKDYALASFGYHLGRPSDVKNYFKKENIFFFVCKLYN